MKAKLTFDQDLNSSLQVGDIIWYDPTPEVGGYKTASTDEISGMAIRVGGKPVFL